MLRVTLSTALLLAGFSLVPISSGQAASFDCSKAGTPFEHAICDSADLSTADERLAKTYATAVGGLSETALDALRTSQREWLDYAQRACTRNAEPLAGSNYDERGVSCLGDLFDSRSDVLETSRMINGLRFYPVAEFSALPDPAEAANPDSNWPLALHELSLVQLDGDEDSSKVFNDLVRAEGELISGVFAPQGGAERVEDDTSSDSTNSITVDDISGNRISLLANTYWFGHGAAHGNYTISYRHYLKDKQRFVEAQDVFSGKGWQKALLTLAVEAAKAEHGDNLMLDDTSYIAESVIDPSRWDLSDPYGLVIQFQPYEISAYAYGAPTARVSWEALAPYLADTADSIRYGF
ncbi:Protein of unknown function [Devosia lucknowensis]|uniref:Lysozyme inhibitor LprI N-terminal domain-containing protein n=1 Tax=Devosia lucknowensis TaxID=1096929 RepID=A0A1Y6FSY3_9HYPH|nr:DUF3298 domain-containing protein [Devosia lucknowensis]SMQ75982.1 Protein of unknown function [Devosia lucknowensis]